MSIYTAPDTMERSVGDLEEAILKLENQIDAILLECRHYIRIIRDAEEVLAYLPSAVEPFPGYSRTLELAKTILGNRHTCDPNLPVTACPGCFDEAEDEYRRRRD